MFLVSKGVYIIGVSLYGNNYTIITSIKLAERETVLGT